MCYNLLVYKVSDLIGVVTLEVLMGWIDSSLNRAHARYLDQFSKFKSEPDPRKWTYFFAKT